MPISSTLQGKHALVTGGTRGIGFAIARGFLEAGATVTLCSRKQENVDNAIAQLTEFQSEVQGVAAHVGKTDDVVRLLATAEAHFGNVHVLVNNAGTNT